MSFGSLPWLEMNAAVYNPKTDEKDGKVVFKERPLGSGSGNNIYGFWDIPKSNLNPKHVQLFESKDGQTQNYGFFPEGVKSDDPRLILKYRQETLRGHTALNARYTRAAEEAIKNEDEEIQNIAHTILGMTEEEFSVSEYHLLGNNCQHFANRITKHADRIAIEDGRKRKPYIRSK